MRVTRIIWLQFSAFVVVAVVASTIIIFGYIKLPTRFGIGRYEVTIQLPEASGLYERANVTYSGVEVGQVRSVELNDDGVVARLSLRSDVPIPSDLGAEVHSVSAVGEQYVALVPRRADAAPLKNGDVITAPNTEVPPDINALLDATNRGLEAIPRDNLKTAIDESYKAFGGLGPEIHRLIAGSMTLAGDAQRNLPDLLNVIDNAAPILDTQSDTADSVQGWARHLAALTTSLRGHDADVRGLVQNGAAAADAGRDLFNRLQPTIPIIAANLASVAPVLVTYRPDLEQLLVLLPQQVGTMQAATMADRYADTPYRGTYLNFKLSVNLPPPCTTGFLPAQQQRAASFEDAPDPPAGDLYCRIPQDSPFVVRGARNYPCAAKPGKRAPTARMCESDEEYVPLNDGLNWKDDPNATLSGQGVPQTAAPPGAPPPAAVVPPIAVAPYDPANGSYIGPDGKLYRQQDLASPAAPKKFEDMMVPGGSP
ncbi:MCE family protein [Mycobacterium sp. NPDC003449]